MIRDVVDLQDGAVVRAGVGIVGAGFAGIDLARYLGRHGVRVALLESGRLTFDPAIQALARIESVGKPVRFPDPAGAFTPYLPAIYRGESRIRQFGGTSAIWTGKWRRFDGLDFEERRWIPHSGWPLDLDTLRPFYDEVAREYGLADFDVYAHEPGIERLRTALGDSGLAVSFHFWEKEPARPARRFWPELERSPSVEVVLGVSAREIVLDDTGRRVREIVGQALDGRRVRMTADQFVLAAGGLETPRLLLASNRQVAGGIGNAHDLVGRFYMDHPKHKRGVLWPGPVFALVGDRVATQPRPRFHLSLSLAADEQRARSLPNHAIYLKAARDEEPARPTTRGGTRRTPRALAAAPQALWRVVRGGRSRPARPITHYTVSMYVEQTPNPGSRVYLGSEPDALGMPRLVVDWRLAAFDHEAFPRILRGLTDACAGAGIGRLEFGPRPLTLDDTVDAAHHMGTTRMATNPAAGVVDPDHRVFGTDNLFVASTAVFPTGHSAAPTFTLLALGRRLGRHLLRDRAAVARTASR
jgi:choline dehydrogenase-like flavoprotein